MRRSKSIRGSSTIFFALILLLVSSLIFALLEAARVEGLKSCAQINSALVTESTLAGYVRPLWDQYHLFALNASDQDGKLQPEKIAAAAQTLAEDNLEGMTERAGYWLYPLHIEQIGVGEYTLVTDADGAEFYRLVTSYMKNNLVAEAAERIYQSIQEGQQPEQGMDELVENAEKSLEEQKAAEQSEEAGSQENVPEVSGEKPTEDDTQAENPLELFREWKTTGVLALVGADTERLSQKSISSETGLQKREKNVGTAAHQTPDDGWYEKILFREYLLQYFPCYEAGKETDHVLDYELEYLLCGKETDRENLTAVCERLLLLREGANYLYLQTDAGKKREARTLAMALAGASGNPLVIIAVQQGILAVWAFAESVSDVRNLLSGEKVPLKKDSRSWNISLTGLTKQQDFSNTKSSVQGLTYPEYLRLLLFADGKETLCLRAMDMMERNLRTIEGCEGLRMDCLMDMCSLEYEYSARPLFPQLVTVGSFGIEEYRFPVQKSGSYLQETM